MFGRYNGEIFDKQLGDDDGKFGQVDFLYTAFTTQHLGA